MPLLGGVEVIERVLVYDDASENFVTVYPEDPDNPVYMLNGGDGLIVYAKKRHTMFFADKECEEIDLQAGFNLAGLACAPEGFTARQLHQALGADKIVSIQRYVSMQGSFQTVAFNQAGEI